MSEFFIIKSFFVFMSVWAVGIVLLWFRPRVDMFWKIIAILIFAFYLWFFFDDLRNGLNGFLADWQTFSVQFLKELTILVFVNLFFIWPITLILVFYKSDDIGAERLLKFVSVLTLVLWIVFIVYFFFNRGVDTHIIDSMKKIFPHGK